LQVTDEDFERAAEASEKGGAGSGARKAAQPGRAAIGGESHSSRATPAALVTCAVPGDTRRHTAQVLSGEDRIRTTAKNPVISALLNDRAAKSAALTVTDAELLQVVQSWASLPNPIKLAILALVQSRLA